MTDDVFVNEDTSKPENRINLSLFGLLTLDAFRSWFLDRLGLPSDAVVHPVTNICGINGSIRPDFVVKHGDLEQTIAWIEVECGRDEEQIVRFRQELQERVIAIWGRPDPLAELSLEEIADMLDRLDAATTHPQANYNVRHLQKLIREEIYSRGSGSSKPAPVSPTMLQTPFVQALCEALGPRLTFDISGPMHRGEIRAQTIAENGFSLRVFAPQSKVQRSLSVLNQSTGRPEVRFPSRQKMYKYLPDRHPVVDLLVDLVTEMGGDMVNLAEKSFTSVPIRTVEQNIQPLANIVVRLAG